MWEHPCLRLWEMAKSVHGQKWVDGGGSWMRDPSCFGCTRRAPSKHAVPTGNILADGHVTFPLPSVSG